MSLEELYDLFMSCPKGFSTDSRKDVCDTFFIALKGESFDGNRYAKDAIRNGALFAVVDDPAIANADKRMLLVPDTNRFLAELAAHHRKTLGVPIVCIGGSNGKTTTRDMTVTILRQKYTVATNFENENNIFGISYTILRTNASHELLVLEIGSNHLGEHRELLRVASPNYILLTNTGKDHLGEYGGIENAKKENLELYDYAKENGALVFVPTFELDLAQEARARNLQTIIFDAPVALPGLLVSFAYDGETIHLPLFGEYMLKNIAAAIAISSKFGLSTNEIKTGLREIRPAKLRGEIVDHASNTLVLDCYNANPSSLAAALASFAKYASKPNAVILGEMHELGEYANAEHEAIAQDVARYGFGLVILVGEHFKRLTDKQGFNIFGDWREAKEFFDSLGLAGYEILVKGSRREALEKIFYA